MNLASLLVVASLATSGVHAERTYSPVVKQDKGGDKGGKESPGKDGGGGKGGGGGNAPDKGGKKSA
jgi:hypothetical protein